MFKRNPQCIIHLSTETGSPPIPIYEKKFIIGRKPTHLVSIPDNSISRDHVEIIIKDDEAYVKDLGTSNGTKIDGHMISPHIPMLCREGQIITLGLTTIGIVIEIFNKDKKKVTPFQVQNRSQQHDYNDSHAQPRTQEDDNHQNPYQPHEQQPAFQQPAYQQPAYQPPVQQQPVHQQPAYQQPAYQQPVYQPPVQEQKPALYSIPQESMAPVHGNSESEILENARMEANRILARAKVDGEMHVHELMKTKELEAHNLVSSAQQKSLEKIKETEQQVQDYLKNTNIQALDLVKNAQTQSQELLKNAQTQSQDLVKNAQNQSQDLVRNAQTQSQEILKIAQTQSQEILKAAQEQTQALLKKTEEESAKIKEFTVEDGRKEKQRIVEGAYLEREAALKEAEAVKQRMPELLSKIEATQAEIGEYQKRKTEASGALQAENLKVQAAAEQVKAHEIHVAKLQEDFKQVQKQVESAEEKYKTTLLSAQNLVKETQETQARVNKREGELTGLIDGAKLQKEDSDKYSAAVKQDADKYAANIKQDADKYSDVTRQDADKYAGHTKLDADKYATNIKQDADKYAVHTKQDADTYSGATKLDADKYSVATKQDADKYSAATKQDADKFAALSKQEADKYSHSTREDIDKYAAVTKLNADKYASVTKEETESEIKRKLEHLQQESEKILSDRERLFQDMKSKQEIILQELKKSEESKTKSILEIDGLLKAKREVMDRELGEKLAEQNAELKAQKDELDKEFSGYKDARELEFKNIRMQQDTFLNDLRRNEEEKIRHMLEESQKMLKTQRDVKINHVQNSLENFFNELQKTAAGDVTEHLPLLKVNLKRLIVETLANEYAGEESELRKILDYNPEISNKHAKFWKKAAVAACLIIVGIVSIVYFRQQIGEIPQDLKASLDQKDQERRLEEQKKTEAKKLAAQYRPAKDLGFKSSYTDNILYTRNYLDFEKDPVVQKDWTLRMNKFLLDTVGILEEGVVVQFITAESGLVRNLESKIELIESSNPDIGIQNMRVVETEYQKLVDTTLKDHKEAFWNLKKEFYEKFMQENAQRFPADEHN